MFVRPLLAFTLIAFLTGSATLFIIEAMASIEGNEEFQASIEFTTIAHLFLGKRWHWVVQIVLYVALQALIITSLIESFQVSWGRSSIWSSSLAHPFPVRAWILFSFHWHTRLAQSVFNAVGYVVSTYWSYASYTSDYMSLLSASGEHVSERQRRIH